ncbi:MAG TPA: divalent-cation tolerance protein CutA [Candidatus Saccharimonadales bacterium]|nr:divalent-cation tolerance protein CutA [Candidatus Saccharimonadales bacterium]
MAKRDYCQLWLTVSSKEEADEIANTLLVKHLVACVKHVSITSDFNWQSKIENSKEVLLVMDSALELFDEIENEVKKLHSYDTFVLQAVPVTKVSKDAEKWLKSELKNA